MKLFMVISLFTMALLGVCIFLGGLTLAMLNEPLNWGNSVQWGGWMVTISFLVGLPLALVSGIAGAVITEDL